MSGKPRGRAPARHGTRARYLHHLRHKEVPCAPCTRANTAYTNSFRDLRRSAMDRDQLQAVIWRHWPTRGTAADASVDAILRAVDAYVVASRWRKPRPRPARPVLRHTSSTDLYPAIRVLAEALLGEDSEQEAAA